MNTELENNVLNLIGRSWTTRIGEQFEKPYMEKMKEQLLSQTFYPKPHNIFRALLGCSFEETRVVFLITDLSTEGNVGLPLSGEIKVGPVHDKFFSGLDDDLGFGDFLAFQPNLNYLPERHVLLLNTSLTTAEDDAGRLAHMDAWEPFIGAVIQSFKEKADKPVCFVLVGEHAQKYAQDIDDLEHSVIQVEHPVDAVAENRPWNHGACFSKSREFVKEYYQQDKIW